MPIYEYRCRSCGAEFEVIHKAGEGPRRKCRECSGRLEKLVSRTSFQLKGSGWFAHGYGEAAPSKTDSDAKKPKSADADSSTKSAEKKKEKKKAAAGTSD